MSDRATPGLRPRPHWAVLSFVDLATPGAKRTHVLEFSRALTRHADVTVLSPTPAAGVRAGSLAYVQCCPPMAQPARLHLPSAAAAAAARLGRLHRSKRLDVVYVRDNVTAIMALAWAGMASVTTALEVNGAAGAEARLLVPETARRHARLWRLKQAVLAGLYRRCYRRAERIVVVSDGLRRHLAAEFGVPPAKVGVFGNGANHRVFVPLDAGECRRKLGLDPGSRYVGFVGNLAPWQGVDDLVRAFALLAAGRDDCRLLIVGDGVEMRPLRELARSLGLEPVVRFAGLVPNPDVVRYTGACDICVGPFGDLARNHVLGFSALKVREYLACGRPVVASEFADTAFIAEAGVGRLYPAGDCRQLAARLDELLRLPAAELAAMGSRARELAVERFSWDSTAAGIFRFVTAARGEPPVPR
jgi:glycosyltransferase involved in cell wall biosynthesis